MIFVIIKGENNMKKRIANFVTFIGQKSEDIVYYDCDRVWMKNRDIIRMWNVVDSVEFEGCVEIVYSLFVNDVVDSVDSIDENCVEPDSKRRKVE